MIICAQYDDTIFCCSTHLNFCCKLESLDEVFDNQEHFINAGLSSEISKIIAIEIKAQADSIEKRKVYVSAMGLLPRSQKILERNYIKTLEDLSHMNLAQINYLRGVGDLVLADIVKCAKNNGLIIKEK